MTSQIYVKAPFGKNVVTLAPGRSLMILEGLFLFGDASGSQK